MVKLGSLLVMLEGKLLKIRLKNTMERLNSLLLKDLRHYHKINLTRWNQLKTSTILKAKNRGKLRCSEMALNQRFMLGMAQHGKKLETLLEELTKNNILEINSSQPVNMIISLMLKMILESPRKSQLMTEIITLMLLRDFAEGKDIIKHISVRL